MSKLQKIVEETERVAIFYFPIVLMSMSIIGLAFMYMSNIPTDRPLKAVLIIIGALINALALYLALKILWAIGKNYDN